MLCACAAAGAFGLSGMAHYAGGVFFLGDENSMEGPEYLYNTAPFWAALAAVGWRIFLAGGGLSTRRPWPHTWIACARARGASPDPRLSRAPLVEA